MIISSTLTEDQVGSLSKVLWEHRGAIGWTIADLKGISPSVCTHKIFMEEDAKPIRQMQRRLNPNMQEAVKKEVIKLLDIGVIYPISDSRKLFLRKQESQSSLIRKGNWCPLVSPLGGEYA